MDSWIVFSAQENGSIELNYISRYTAYRDTDQLTPECSY